MPNSALQARAGPLPSFQRPVKYPAAPWTHVQPGTATNRGESSASKSLRDTVSCIVSFSLYTLSHFFLGSQSKYLPGGAGVSTEQSPYLFSACKASHDKRAWPLPFHHTPMDSYFLPCISHKATTDSNQFIIEFNFDIFKHDSSEAHGELRVENTT